MTADWLIASLVLFVSYLLGSIPVGYLYGRLRGVDIRTVGSRNVGATNVMRTFGTPAGVLVMLLDAAKGFAAVFILTRFTAYADSDLIRVGGGLAAIFGHTFTVFLGFKGGKGVATSLGVFLALAPVATAVALVPFVLMVALTKYISAGSLTAAILFPVLVWLAGEAGQYQAVFILSLVVALVIILRHRANLGRIWHGTENKIGQRIPPSPKEKA